MSGAIPRRTRKDVLPSTIAKKSLLIQNVNLKNWNPSTTSPDEKLNASFAKSLSKIGARPLNDTHIIGMIKNSIYGCTWYRSSNMIDFFPCVLTIQTHFVSFSIQTTSFQPG